jgi:hypothetical protein
MSDADPEHAALRAWVLWASGEREAGQRLARKLVERAPREPVRPGILAALYGLLGDSDRAFALLERAYEERDWTLREVKMTPMLDPLRADPRFLKLLKKLNLG